MIDKITVSLVTYNSTKSFPGMPGVWYLEGLVQSLAQVDIIDEIFLIEKEDEEHPALFTRQPPISFVDERWTIKIAPNDPPYADPFRQHQLCEARNDWVLILDDDERISWGMAQFINSLKEQDPCPDKDWVAISFPREDYIYHMGNWRYCPANGQDHQYRLVNRKFTQWGSDPHTLPQFDGTVLHVSDARKSILHYRDYDKIVSWSAHCNEMFKDKPQIVSMQDAYLQRVQQLLGVS